MRSMSERQWFYVFLDQFNENERNAESARQYRCSVPMQTICRARKKGSAH